MRGKIAVPGIVGKDEKNVWLGRKRHSRRLGDMKDEKKRYKKSRKFHCENFVINNLRCEQGDSTAQFQGGEGAM